MSVTTTLKKLKFSDGLELIDEGAVFIDLRPTEAYLDVHVPGSLDLVYEWGPGMSTRARDCIPLTTPLILIEDGEADMVHAAASLRGKGFNVAGVVDDAVNNWVKSGGKPASTEVLTAKEPPGGLLLDVADPGAKAPQGATRIPADSLWKRSEEFAAERRVTVVAGYGVRAGLALGILEHAGVRSTVFWKTLS